jgi:hypothetical protein
VKTADTFLRTINAWQGCRAGLTIWNKKAMKEEVDTER